MTEIEMRLNQPDRRMRLAELMEALSRGTLTRGEVSGQVNNHIHTTYSFSPYSPTLAVAKAYEAGLSTAGIMDHDSIGGAEEFVEAGRLAGIATTVGVECRVDMSDTVLGGRRFNNPDQKSIAYIALHGIPHTQFARVAAFFQPYIAARMVRNRLMTGNLNALLAPHGITLDFEADVLPLSEYPNGGTVTERHLLFAVSQKLLAEVGTGEPLVRFLEETLGVAVPDKVRGWLLDSDNPYLAYDLLGVLKSGLVHQFYIDAKLECPDVREVVALANEVRAICAYAYLGDVGDSVTGDKKAQQFEDAYLEELFGLLSALGFHAVTYMPSRNSMLQLTRVMALCDQYHLFQISGEDINTPRQAFFCEKLRDPAFHPLMEATWALIGHEKQATMDLSRSMFSPAAIAKYPDLKERIAAYAAMGRE